MANTKKSTKKVVKKKVAKKIAKKVVKKDTEKVAKKVVKKIAKKVVKKKIAKKVVKKKIATKVTKKTNSKKVITNGFKDDYLVVMQRDPNWLHAFWNVDERRRKKLAKENKKMVLKLYDVASDLTIKQSKVKKVEDKFEFIEVPETAKSWYIEHNINEKGAVRAELGSIDKKGDFEALVLSNTTEDNHSFKESYTEWQKGVDAFVSESLGEQEIWDFWSSGEAMRKTSRYAKNPLDQMPLGPSSGPISSGEFLNQSGKGINLSNEDIDKNKDFFFWVKTRLIVYGGTKPDAKLTVRGEPFELNADGTFSFDMDLEDSTQIIPIRAVGAENENGDQDETITPIVVKRTE